MKSLQSILGLMILISSAQARPILNENVAANTVATVYPDSDRPDVFYILPDQVEPCLNESNNPIGGMIKYKSGLFKRDAVLTLSICPHFNYPELNKTKSMILEKIPEAKFVVIPITQSKLVLFTEAMPYIESTDCNQTSAPFGSLNICHILMKKRGWSFVTKHNGQFILPLYFQYAFIGVFKNPDGSLTNQDALFEVPYNATRIFE